MLPVKVSIVYIVLVGLLTGAAVGLIHMSVGDLAVSQTSATLQQAVVGAEQSAHLEEASLIARAQFVGRSDRLYRSLQGEFVGKAVEGEEGEAEAKPNGADFEGQRHLDADEKLKAQKFHLDDIAKAESSKRAESRSVLAREPHELDMFMVLDEKGKGVAALGKDLYSWFGADVAKQFPEVAEVAKGGEARAAYWMWSFKPGEEKRLYRVAIAPLRRTADEAPAGVVVLGAMVNDGLAKRKRELFGIAPDDESVHLVFYRGDTIVGSTFGSARQLSVAAAMAGGGLTGAEPADITEIVVDGVPYLAVSRPLSTGGTPVGVAAVASITAAKAPMNSLRVDVLLTGVLFILFGVVLLVILIHRYIKPVEDLEDGVQEVIAGNRDYVWKTVSGHELQAGLAQQLNLMSAFLQGKPMPDDDSSGQGWGELMPGQDTKPQAPGQVQGVDLAGLMGARPKGDDGDNG